MPAAASVLIASTCAFAIIATQVAGKATRDALFLTNFDVSHLPAMLTVSALVSIGAALLTARSIALFGPSRIIPPSFLMSGLFLIAEWLFAMKNAKLASPLVYLHIAIIGSILISGFWSIINEHFDPHSARKSIGRIVGGATFGGLGGGFLAERVGTNAGILWVLPIIASLQIACAFLLRRLESVQAPSRPFSMRVLLSGSGRGEDRESAFQVLRRAPYVRSLALIVLLGNAAATILDFLFKALATQSYPGGGDLVRFFAIFYTAVSLITLAVQAGVTTRLLEKFGIANTMTLRPVVVTIGGLIALPWISIITLGILRGLEAVAQSSLFRSGYELLFSPVVPEDKRKTRTIVDAGADRAGDIAGAILVRVVILLPAALSGQVLITLAIAISLVGFGVARALRRGYIQALETNLIDRANRLDIAQDEGGPRTTMMESFTGLDLSRILHRINPEALRAMHSLPAGADKTPEAVTAADRPKSFAAADPELALLAELRSGDEKRVSAALRHAGPMSPLVATQVISLLAWNPVTGQASRALAKTAATMTGQLIDRMLDPGSDFAVRRRIPRILSTCNSPRAFDGLMAALSDPRFEVRFQAGRALVRIHSRHPSRAADQSAVYETVLRETGIGKTLWKDQRLLDDLPEEEAGDMFVGAMRARVSRSMEHVFTLLSLVLPRIPLQIAFKGLHTNDPVLRGTSLEYMESVLPREVWEGLRPFLEDSREASPTRRTREEVLEDLMRSSVSIDLKLKKLVDQNTE
jgi:AAA family ATP:ADP antiporter